VLQNCIHTEAASAYPASRAVLEEFSYRSIRTRPHEGRSKMNPKMKVTWVVATIAMSSAYPALASAQYVVQIPVDSVLENRSVNTLTGGMVAGGTVTGGTVVPFTNGDGIFGGGSGGYATAEVQAELAPTSTGVGLPDDGLFPAAGNLPAFQLHFSNDAPATSFQTRRLPAAGAADTQTFQFPVPPASYTALYLILASGDGTASFNVTLSYAGGTPSTMTTITNLPDAGLGVTMGGPAHFYIITNTGKWYLNPNKDAEPTGHTIEGIEITPSPAPAILTGVSLTKTNGAVLVFWGATGIATTPVDGGVMSVPEAGAGEDASIGDATASSGTVSSGASSGTSSTGTAVSGTSSGASQSGGSAGAPGSSTGGTAAGSGAASSGTTTSGGGTSSGSNGNGSGSSATTSKSSSSSGCSLGLGSPRFAAAWGSLAALGLLMCVRRSGARKSETARRRSL